MSIISDEEFKKAHDQFNDEPVYYCKNCLSLNIKGIKGMDYCDSCSSTNIDSCNIHEWEKMYEERFGHKHLDEY